MTGYEKNRLLCLAFTDDLTTRKYQHFIWEGTKRGIQECQSQFQTERWNCSDSSFARVQPTGEAPFSSTLERGKEDSPSSTRMIKTQTMETWSRETAFLYAITSAGVVHAVTEACSSGNMTECSCDRSRLKYNPTVRDWKWGGCSDNIRYGMAFAKHFVDGPDRQVRKQDSGDMRSLMNLHNNRAGRIAVAKHMDMKCRCHGISGSCELKTCWRTLPPFSQVGRYLKNKYDSSQQINEKSTRRRLQKSKEGKVKRKVVVTVPREDLVYLHKSPNYCLEDRVRGIFGTTGRTCSKTSDGPDSCNILCCGRGYNTMVKRISTRCDCKFEWCCNVECKICDKETEVYTCK